MSRQCKYVPLLRGSLSLLAGALLAFALRAEAVAQHPAKDALGDPLPDGAVARLGTVRWSHGGQVTFAAFPDAKTVLTAGVDKTIRVWEFPSGRELRRIDPLADEPGIRPAGLAFANDFPVALSKDAKTVAACYEGGEILLFDVATGKDAHKTLMSVGPRVGRRAGIQSLAFSPAGQQLAILGGDGSGRIWDWSKGGPPSILAGADPNVANFAGALGASAVWSPDGKALATVKEQIENKKFTDVLEMWGPAGGVKWRKPGNDRKGNHGLVFSPDSTTLAVAGRDGRIAFLDVATGKEVRSWEEAPGLALLLFSRDGAKLYGRPEREDGLVEWDAATGKKRRKIALAAPARGRGPRSVVSNLGAAWSPDGRLLVLSGAGSAPQFVDVAAGKEIDAGAGQVFSLSLLRFTPDSKHLWTRSGDGTVRKWSATGNKFDLPLKQFTQALPSPDGKLLVAPSSTGPADGAFVDAATGKELGSLPGLFPPQADSFRGLLFSPDSKMLASRFPRARTITLYEAPTGKLLHTLPIVPILAAPGQPPQLAPPVVFFSQDSKILAAFADPTTLALWDTASGKRIGELKPENPISVNSGAFSPDGRCIALDRRDGRPIVYELASARVRSTYGSQVRIPNTIKPAPIPEPRIAFGTSGQTLIHAGVDRTTRVWDVASGKELMAFKGHTGSVDALALAGDGKTLATASADNTVLLWDMTRVQRPALAVKALTRIERDARWQTLLDTDAARAFAAMCDLSVSPEETLALLKERIKPAPPLENDRIEQLVAALGSAQLKTREQARAELIKMDERVVPAIDKTLAKNPPLEYKRRLDELRQELGGIGILLIGEPLRMYRAVEVLERIGTEEARQLLQALAAGTPGTSLTTTAQTTLQRLRGK